MCAVREAGEWEDLRHFKKKSMKTSEPSKIVERRLEYLGEQPKRFLLFTAADADSGHFGFEAFLQDFDSEEIAREAFAKFNADQPTLHGAAHIFDRITGALIELRATTP